MLPPRVMSFTYSDNDKDGFDGKGCGDNSGDDGSDVMVTSVMSW